MISPLLANVYLHVLDSYWANHKELGEIVRYADDAVIICYSRRDAERAFAHLTHVMEHLKLTLHPVKTRIVDMNSESFDFHGYTFQKFHNRRQNRKLPYRMPSKKALRKVKDSIREITCRKSAYEPLNNKVIKLNPLIRGWRNYFEDGNSVKRFIQLDEYIWMKLWRQRYCYRKQRKYRDKALMDFKRWYSTNGIEFFYTPNKTTMVDYYGIGVLTVLTFYFFQEQTWKNRLIQFICLYILNIKLLGGYYYTFQIFGYHIEFFQQAFAMISLLPIWLYQGHQGFHNKIFQWACYAFYPIHIII